MDMRCTSRSCWNEHNERFLVRMLILSQEVAGKDA